MRLKILVFVFLLPRLISESTASEDCFTSDNLSAWMDIRTGQQTFSALPAEQKFCVAFIENAMKMSKPPKDTEECQHAWDRADDKASELERATDDLLRKAKKATEAAQSLKACSNGGDYQQDCYWASSGVETAVRQLENAASTAVSRASSYDDATSKVRYECD